MTPALAVRIETTVGVHGGSFPTGNVIFASKVFSQGVKFAQFSIPLSPATSAMNSFPAMMLDCSCDCGVTGGDCTAFITGLPQHRIGDVCELAFLLCAARFLCVSQRVFWFPRHKKRAPSFLGALA